jgi:hypothetical protein
MSPKTLKKQRAARDQLMRPVRAPIPRTRVPVMTQNATLVHSRYITANVSTGTGVTQTASGLNVSPGLHSGTDAAAAIIKNYQEYRIRSTSLIYTPQVGSTTAGVIYLAYVDNPEIIYGINAGSYSSATIQSIIQSTDNVVSGPIWMPLVINGRPTTRRKQLSVDTSVPTSSVEADRSVSGMYLWSVSGVTALTTFGVFTHNYVVEGMHLQNISFTSV